MNYPERKFSKTQITKAGEILKMTEEKFNVEEQENAYLVLANWRACHTYPLNTFQATLRKKLSIIDKNAFVGQRLKRAHSIILKLRRFDTMDLARMQDIAGLRAVVLDIKKVYSLEESYRNARFHHKLASFKDYIKCPKKDGYRGIHMIYRYNNKRAAKWNGLNIELQIRTRLQHSWATAVEIMGIFLKKSLKSGMGPEEWKKFFSATSAAFAMQEGCASVPGFEGKSLSEIVNMIRELERKLQALAKLRGFSVAVENIPNVNNRAYSLIRLDTEKRTVRIMSFTESQSEEANNAYAREEANAIGKPIEVVLVRTKSIKSLKRAYPNYFLDSKEFVRHISNLLQTYPS